MYIDFLYNDKNKVLGNINKAHDCEVLLKELGLNTCDIEKYVDESNDKITCIDKQIKEYNYFTKRGNVTGLRFYVNDNYTIFDAKDMLEITKAMRKFKLTPFTYKDKGKLTSYYRNLFIISTKELQEYEISIISNYFIRARYFKTEDKDSLFKWDGEILEPIADTNEEMI